MLHSMRGFAKWSDSMTIIDKQSEQNYRCSRMIYMEVWLRRSSLICRNFPITMRSAP